jgi:PAS domain S-box-containing protein
MSIAMKNAELQLRGLDDPRLAVHATSALPAWLWSIDGTRILWANPVGAKLFGAPNGVALAQKSFGPADARRRLVCELAATLPAGGATRLERLRGFGAPLGLLVTCACLRLQLAGGREGILIAAAESVGGAMPLSERLQKLVEAMNCPIAAFTAEGALVATSEAARPTLVFRNLSEIGLDHARQDALKHGRAEALSGSIVLHRLGAGPDLALVALIAEGSSILAAHPAPQRAVPADKPTAVADQASAEIAAAPGLLDEPVPQIFRHPLRFVWQMDADGHFSIDSEEFIRLIGARAAANLRALSSNTAEAFAMDPDGRFASAVATRDTWSGVTLNWPVDGGGRLPVELSGLPTYDRQRNFTGYRGFGVCRDLDALTGLAALSCVDFSSTSSCSSTLVEASTFSSDSALAAKPAGLSPDTASITPETSAPFVSETSSSTDLETPVDTPKNVVPFRPAGDTRPPVLSPVENSAFDELARQLSARLQSHSGGISVSTASQASETGTEHPGATQAQEVSDKPEWLEPPEPPAHGESRRDRALLDLLPVGVLIYRLDRLVYANPEFLKQMGYSNLHALEEAGGLDALYVEAGVSSSSSTSDTGTPVKISGPQTPAEDSSGAIDARLYTINWDNESALALIFAAQAATGGAIAAAIGQATPEPSAPPASDAPIASAPSPVGHANAEELGAILDTTTDGIVMFDGDGRLNSCNQSAQALFGYDGDELTRRGLSELFAPESQRIISDYLESTKASALASVLDQGREVLGRTSRGGIIPLSMTMGRTRHDGPNFFAVFRDLSQARKSEGELQQARRMGERAAEAKADLLARISHEVRIPLNAIIGFSEVMIDERFGALGNERYVEYMKDIRASGERVISIIDGLLDLSRIETGKLDLSFTKLNLNDLVEQCVTAMQPQANRERIIIRTSLGQALPPVVADPRILRQIASNLIGNSIHLANAGGQVIVSTALSDFGDVVLRVRDTGRGLSEHEVAAAMEPFRTRAPSEASDSSGLSLSLAKALVEASRAQFQIKTGPQSGTLIEVVFSQVTAKT